MLTVTKAWIRKAEAQSPGFRETLEYYEALDLPPCPRCSSTNTAKVSSGLVGRSMALAAATTKMKLVPNRKPGEDFHCGACDQFFGGNPRTGGALSG